jgi:hypothetical protein
MCGDANQMRANMDMWPISVISIGVLTQDA